jgi:hypothetical protein
MRLWVTDSALSCCHRDYWALAAASGALGNALEDGVGFKPDNSYAFFKPKPTSIVSSRLASNSEARAVRLTGPSSWLNAGRISVTAFVFLVVSLISVTFTLAFALGGLGRLRRRLLWDCGRGGLLVATRLGRLLL